MVNCNYSEDEILCSVSKVSKRIDSEDALVGFELLACEILGVNVDRLYELINEYGDKREKEMARPGLADEEREL